MSSLLTLRTAEVGEFSTVEWVDSKATVAMNDDEAGQAQRDVLHTRIVDLCNILTGLLEQSNHQNLKEPILALKRAILPAMKMM